MTTLTTTTQSKIKTGDVVYWLDAQGNQINEKNISDIDKIRDEFVNESMANFLEGVNYLKALKKEIWHALDEFLAISASDYEKEYKGTRGGFTLETFNSLYRIRVCIADTQQVDERIETARTLLKQVMRRWAAEGINENLRTIIEKKYAVNEKGHVNVKEMLSLRRHKFDDSEWKEAMDAITDSLFTSGSKSYLRYYIRNEETGRYQQIKADFSAI